MAFMRRDFLKKVGLAAVGGGMAWLPAMPALAQFEVTPWGAREVLPPIDAQDLDGKTWRFADLKGRAVLLNFWASWCEPCRAEMPTLQQIADLYGADKLVVLAMNFKESPTRAAQFARMTGMKLPILLDPIGAVAKQCGVNVFPTTLLIAADGKPRQRVRGELDWTGRDADRLVQALVDAPAQPPKR